MGRMEVDEALVRQVAHLARLALTDEEVRETVPGLARILAHVEQVQELDLEGAEPLPDRPAGPEALRDDVPGPTLDLREIVENAPAHDGAFLVVPRFFEE
jgi:aspartyl-tRNA(Asn)/glutamyl-tRNA(Gln) amidotransferase subunit C